MNSPNFFDCDILKQLVGDQEFEPEFKALKKICMGYSTFRSSSFVACSMFFIYSGSLLFIGLVAHFKGHSIWLSAATAPGFYPSRVADVATSKKSEMETIRVPTNVPTTPTTTTATMPGTVGIQTIQTHQTNGSENISWTYTTPHGSPEPHRIPMAI
jgi:hypothetical protein